MSEARPKLGDALGAFREVYEDVGKTVSGVGTKIGGRVNHNINNVPVGKGKFENACAIRMSYVLNKTGSTVPFIRGQTVSGGNGKWYIFRVNTLIKYLRKTFGEPDHVFEPPTKSVISKYKGILVFEVDSWSDASGHATIWDGNICSDKCYFPISKKAFLWKLKN